MISKQSKKGFTLVELSIALVFISFLLLIIATTTIQIANTYNQGLTIKSAAQAARSIVSDLQQEIRAVQPFSLDTDFVDIETSNGVVGGRLCLGTFSYIWNYAQPLNNNDTGSNVYTDSTSNIRFVKVQDTSKYYCQNLDAKIDRTKSQDLLILGDKTLSMYSFNITSPVDLNYDSGTNTRNYYVEFYLGSKNPDYIVDSTGQGDFRCKNSEEQGSNLTYCVVKLFSISVLSGT